MREREVVSGGRWAVGSGQWPVAGEQWPVGGGQRAAGRGVRGPSGVRGSLLGTQYSVLSTQYSARNTRHLVFRMQRSSLIPHPSSLIPHPSAARRGVSLMEVLVSMGLILFGLFAVAALLEVGRSEMGSATRMDRALACGRSGLAEVKIRGMDDPNQWQAWYDANNPYPGWTSSSPTPGRYTVPTYEPQLQYYQAYAIDPLYIARFLNENPGATPTEIAFNTARFPYGTTAALYMARCSFGTGGAGNLALFDRMFIWPDDQVFNIPKALDQRPTRQFDSSGIPQSEGNYSWLMTVCPPGTEAGQNVVDRSVYEVSVVVFYQRDFSPPMSPTDPDKPGERVVTVSFTGGGDVTLGKAATDPVNTLDVRENDWILIGGRAGTRNVFKWYRVITAESAETAATNTRRATLAGPDWPSALGIDTNGDGIADLPPQGILFTGVAGVYTSVVSVNQ